MLAILTLFFVYLLPSVIRSAQVVAEARIEDRFSSDLQIIATAGHRQEKAHSQGRTYIHPPRTSEHPMNTPVARTYAAADQRRIAVARAARAAAASRRAAAAKRRMVLLTASGALTLSAWVLSVMTAFPWLIAAVLTAATVGVVELGRRAAAAGQQADVELAKKVRLAETRAEANVEKLRPQKTSAPAPAPVEEAPASSLRVETELQDSTWTPVPVPPPAYTLKAEVRRKTAEPYEELEPAAPTAKPAPTPVPAPAAEESPVEESSTLNVQEILARRRAVG